MRVLGVLLWSMMAMACGSKGKPEAIDAAAAVDAAPDAGRDGAPWAPGASMTHVVFLQTEGVTLTSGPDNATTDTASVAASSGTVDAWRKADASRATEIAALASQIAGVVAPYDITIVTTRPSTGTYHEVVITDSAPTALGVPQGTAAITPASATCNAYAAPVSVTFASAFGTAYNQAMADFVTNSTVAMIGLQGGVPLSTQANDCMCFVANSCGSGSGACTIGGAGVPVDTNVRCGDPDPTMNEAAVFLAAFGAH